MAVPWSVVQAQLKQVTVIFHNIETEIPDQ